MSDTPDAKASPADQVERQARKPWHAPQFVESGFIETDGMCNAANDGPGLS
jgi:hypothetical protein